MTRQVINIGDTANDRKGDSLRTAFAKVNANFTEVYSLAGTGGVTVGTIDGGGAASVFTNDDLSIDGGAASTIFNNQ
jgi:hypothetical protein